MNKKPNMIKQLAVDKQLHIATLKLKAPLVNLLQFLEKATDANITIPHRIDTKQEGEQYVRSLLATLDETKLSPETLQQRQNNLVHYFKDPDNKEEIEKLNESLEQAIEEVKAVAEEVIKPESQLTTLKEIFGENWKAINKQLEVYRNAKNALADTLDMANFPAKVFGSALLLSACATALGLLTLSSAGGLFIAIAGAAVFTFSALSVLKMISDIAPNAFKVMFNKPSQEIKEKLDDFNAKRAAVKVQAGDLSTQNDAMSVNVDQITSELVRLKDLVAEETPNPEGLSIMVKNMMLYALDMCEQLPQQAAPQPK